MDTPTVVQVTEPAKCEVARLPSVRPYPSSCIEREGNGRRTIHGLLTTLDPSLTLTRMQYPAIPGNRGNRKRPIYAGYAIPCNPRQPLTHTRNEQVSGSSPLVGSFNPAYPRRICEVDEPPKVELQGLYTSSTPTRIATRSPRFIGEERLVSRASAAMTSGSA